MSQELLDVLAEWCRERRLSHFAAPDRDRVLVWFQPEQAAVSPRLELVVYPEFLRVLYRRSHWDVAEPQDHRLEWADPQLLDRLQLLYLQYQRQYRIKLQFTRRQREN